MLTSIILVSREALTPLVPNSRSNELRRHWPRRLQEQALQWGEHFRKSALGICDLANEYRKHDGCMFLCIMVVLVSASGFPGTMKKKIGWFGFLSLGVQFYGQGAQ